MTLLELLVKELPARGGWPEGYHYAAQDRDSELFFYEHKPKFINGEGGWDPLSGEVYSRSWQERPLATDHATAVITLEQYEAALAAKTEPPVWDGEGLPPVGVVCEMQDEIGRWIKVEIIAIHENHAHGWESKSKQAYYSLNSEEFRPIRTHEQIEAERRDRVMKQMLDAWILGDGTFESVCNAIYDAIRAGKIEGVKIAE